MAETLISPGVLARENDLSFIQNQPIEAGTAIIGPTVKGPVEIPTLVTSYSEYKNRFGTTFESGSDQYTFLTSIAAYNYFQQGGTSLLVTRVTSGSFTSAETTEIFNQVPTTLLSTATDELLDSITTIPTDASASVYTGVALVGGSGAGGQATVTITNTLLGGGAYGSSDYSPDLSGITVTAAGSGYVDGDILTIPSASLGGGSTIVTNTALSNAVSTPGGLPVNQTGLEVAISSTNGNGTLGTASINTNSAGNITSVEMAAGGIGYAVGNTLTITAADIGSGATSDITITLAEVDMFEGVDVTLRITGSTDLQDNNAFVLETISEGLIQNSVSTESTNGLLPSGTADNIRWEITTANTESGTFTLFVRRGDDIQNEKVILESFTNLSLDPFSEDYIVKRIGNLKEVITDDQGEFFLKQEGEYANRSRFIRVKSVNYQTPRYFDNNGDAKPEFFNYLPTNQSGSFKNATGDIIPTGRAANYYDKIDANDTQGLEGSDYDTAINLLANKDSYRYSLLVTPGLVLQTSNHASQLTQIRSTAQSRGDFLAVQDPVFYGANILDVTGAVVSLNTSYSAVYWPWLQTVDADSAATVFVPASAMLPGVFAFNDSVAEPWFAPAGINRGSLPGVVRAERRLTQGNRDDLYSANVNPIATFPNAGVVVFGQKTTQKKASALDRVNVRRLLIALKGFISQVADNLVFEQNTIATRNNFLAQVNPYLASVQERQGIFAFKVVMDETNNTPDVIDRNQLVGQIFIQPTRTAEFIILDFNVLPTGAEFPE